MKRTGRLKLLAIFLTLCLICALMYPSAVYAAEEVSWAVSSSGNIIDDGTVKYTNSGFTVTASNADTLYVCEPDGEYAYVSGLSYSVPSASKEGVYRFAAQSGTGNSSIQVWLDKTAPELSDPEYTYNNNGTVETIRVTAYDAMEIGVKLYVKVKDEETLLKTVMKDDKEVSATGTLYTGNYSFGYYDVIFRAVDTAGNESSKTASFDVYAQNIAISDAHYEEDGGDEWRSFDWGSEHGWKAELYRREDSSKDYTHLSYSSAIKLSGRESMTVNELNKECLRENKENYRILDYDGYYIEGAPIAIEGEYKLVWKSPTGGENIERTFSLSHRYILQTDLEPTCHSKGRCYYWCFKCSDGISIELNETAHEYDYDIVQPTCTEPGKLLAWCRNEGCPYNIEEGGEYIYSEDLPVAGHEYRLSEHIEQTCQTAECNVYVCGICGNEYFEYMTDKDDLASCSYVKDYERSVSPTCTESGTWHYVCEWCGADGPDEEREPLGHSFYVAGDEAIDGETMRLYVCSVCGYSYYAEAFDANDTANAVVNAMLGYFNYMWWILLAGVALWAIYAGVKYATSRDEAEAASVRRQIINFAIGVFVIALIVVGIPGIVYGIASIV